MGTIRRGKLTQKLPRGWHRRVDKTTGERYYYNRLTHQRQWSRPYSIADVMEGEIELMPTGAFVRICQIVIKHRERDDFPVLVNMYEEPVTRSRKVAKRFTVDLRDSIEQGIISFENAVVEFSEISTASQLGYMGRIQRKVLKRALEEAVFALEVGQLSKVVHSPLGYHIFKRIPDDD